jgi:hypothetical protein
MKTIRTNKAATLLAVLLLSGALLLGGCVSTTPTGSPASPSVPSGPSTGAKEAKVVYNYGETGKVQLSENDIVLKVGDRLILQPAAGLTKNTRFKSAGKHFIGDILKQETGQPNSGQVIFTAVKAGKGQLQVIPDTDKTDRAVDLWVTVE